MGNLMKEGEYFFTEGQFDETWDSLQSYSCPDWFRNAKFGIWSHWGPQVVPMRGDWYARNMYIEGHEQYEYHKKTYGHPSKVGFKDIIDMWKAENFDPQELMKLYKKAGAKYFVAQAGHHDNFDNWDSVYQPRWNSVKHGPMKDICGDWKKAADKEGLRYGLSEHIERSYSWFNTNKGADCDGPYKDVPYDGNNSEYEDLYFKAHEDISQAYPLDPSDWWVWNWYARIYDAVEQLKPDLLYTDGALPFGKAGRRMLANFYNRNLKNNDGKLEAVYNLKDLRKHDKKNGRTHGDFKEGVGVLDMERGTLNDIHPEPWQTDTCLGNWFYKENNKYKSAEQVIKMLVDIVSKNGNLLLNIPQLPDGGIDKECRDILKNLGDWMEQNGEAIYGTRPWEVYGEGPVNSDGGHYNEKELSYTGQDMRFTQKDKCLYVSCLSRPENGKIVINSLGSESRFSPPFESLSSVTLLGREEVLEFKQDCKGLTITLSGNEREQSVYCLKLS